MNPMRCVRLTIQRMLWCLASTQFVVILVAIGCWEWRTPRCAFKHLYRGLPLAVFHYKKSQEEMRIHYRDTWEIVGEKGDHRSNGRDYVGMDPLSDPTLRKNWNDCPNTDATRFGWYQRMAWRVPWSVRSNWTVAKATGPICLPQHRVRGPRCRPFFAAAEVVVRRERLEYIKEFIEHYLAVGFGHLYIAVDEDKASFQKYQSAFQRYVDAGVLTLWTATLGTMGELNKFVPQGRGHLAVGKEYANATFWMARVDIDEFIVPLPPLDSVVPFLLPLTGRHEEVPFQLKMGRVDFGDSGWVNRPPPTTPIVEAYTRSMATPNSVKPIFQTDALLLGDHVTGWTGNPHKAFDNERLVGTCQDAHWVSSARFACWPQFKRVYRPPPLPANVSVPLRTPLSQYLYWPGASVAEPPLTIMY